MSESNLWIRFVLAVLATWRVTHLLASEDGPADVVARIRARLGSGLAGKLMDCFNCLSLWVAAPMAFFITQKPRDVLLVWFALSGAACLLELIGQERVVIQPASQPTEGEVDNGMLRRETSCAEEYVIPGDEGGRNAGRAS